MKLYIYVYFGCYAHVFAFHVFIDAVTSIEYDQKHARVISICESLRFCDVTEV